MNQEELNKELNRKDHFVSQTYLKHFGYLGKFVFWHRKKESLVKEVPINSICLERGGDVCENFENILALRDILKRIEPSWNFFIEGIINENLNQIHDDRSKNEELSFLHKICLFMSYLRSLSPTIRKLAKETNEGIINNFYLPRFTEHGQFKQLHEPIIKGEIKVEVGDTNYYKAQGINFLAEFAEHLYNRTWLILVNTTDVKFITSDTPFISLDNNRLYLPLTPTHALIFDKSFSHQIVYHKVSAFDVRRCNREIVKFADDQIISSTEDAGVSKLVEKYRKYEAFVKFESIKEKDATTVIFRHQSVLKK